MVEPLEGVIQNYAWGSTEAIAAIRGVEPSDKPEAELWFGAHDVVSATLPDRGGRQLGNHIAEAPGERLGADVAGRFGGRLPFLLKILAAVEPLSIQAHPTRAEAEAGFDREEAEGIDRVAPERCYRDRNPKPELIVAVTPFEALVGFRPAAEVLELLGEVGLEALAPLGEALRAGDHLRAFEWILTDAESDVVDAVVERLDQTRGGHHDLLVRLHSVHPGDPGVLTAALLNHVVLAPGEALFLDAGTLHAYIQGVGVELMSNSDNVLRGGLTKKHVDTGELLRILRPEPRPVEMLMPTGAETTYSPPVAEFELTRLVEPAAVERRPSGPEIVLVVEGTAVLSGPVDLTVEAGSGAWIDAGTERYEIDGSGLVFVAAVGALHSPIG